MAQRTNKKMESFRPVFECMTCKAFPTIESVKNNSGIKCTYRASSMLQPKETPKCRNGHDTGKSITITNLKKDELEW